MFDQASRDASVAAPPNAVQADTPLLEARGLGFRIGNQRLIDEVDLAIKPARRTVIMGANGSGKSLLLRLLHGLLTPSSGQIFWRGRPLDRQGRRAQAMVFQRPVMLRRSVLANLRFALRARGLSAAERTRREIAAIEQARLGHLLDRPARLLSGGEQQRLAIARALACEPQLLLLDEPTASLDPASTYAIEELIQVASAQQIGIVMVTHDQGQARRLAQDIVFLHAGRIVEIGLASQILDDPQSTAARCWLEGRLYLEP